MGWGRRFLWGRKAPVLGDHPKVDGTTRNLSRAGLKEGLLISLPQRLIRARSRSQRNELSRTDSSTLLLSGRAEWVGMSPEMLPKRDGVLGHGAVASPQLFAWFPELRDPKSNSWPFGSSKL